MFRRTIALLLGKEKGAEYRKLLKQKDYLAVGKKYGRLVYTISISASRRKRVLNKLAREDRIEEASHLYSKRRIKKAEILRNDYSKYRNSSNKVIGACFFGTKRILRCRLAWAMLIMYMLATPLMTFFLYCQNVNGRTATNEAYANEIHAFERNAEEYGEYVYFCCFEGNDNLSICNKIMYDMWTNIKGYGNPEMDINGAYRLDIVSEDGVGVCRNMADYMSNILEHQMQQLYGRLKATVL